MVEFRRRFSKPVDVEQVRHSIAERRSLGLLDGDEELSTGPLEQRRLSTGTIDLLASRGFCW